MMKIKLPANFEFDGVKFGNKFLPDFDPNIPDPRFWFDGEGYLVCPSLPDDIDIDLSMFEVEIAIEPEIIFDKPIRTPAIYAEDIKALQKEIDQLKKVK